MLMREINRQVLLILVIFYIGHWSEGAEMRRTIFKHKTQGYRLNGFLILEKKTLSFIECAHLCQQHIGCKSLNFQTSGKPHHKCQLNNATMSSEDARKVKADDFNYHEIFEPFFCTNLCTCSGCENGGRCDDKTKTCICDPSFYGERCDKAATKLTGYFIVDDSGTLYVDGNEMGYTDIYAAPLYFQTFVINKYKEILIHGLNPYGVGGLMASFSDGSMTNTSWVCRTKDDGWKPAVSYGRNDYPNSTWRSWLGVQMPNIPPEAEWIWTKNAYDQDVQCRTFF